MRRLLVVLAVLAAAAVVPVPARAAGLGGYTLSARATPVAIHLFEPIIPIPAQPQVELDLSYSQVGFASGPTGRAVSSLLWPGDGVAYGLPTLIGNPDAAYPLKVDAAHPSGPAQAEQAYGPATAMTAHADEQSSTAATALGKPALPALPAIPVPGITFPSMLVAAESFSSQGTAGVVEGKATATAYATAGSVSLLGGLVKIDGLRAQTEASSDGAEATTEATVSWSSLTLVGQRFAATQSGVASPAGVTPLPQLPADVSRRMADFGLSIEVPRIDETKDGAAASVTGRGLTVTVDTAVLKAKLALGAILDPLVALLPAELRNQLTPWLTVAPKISFIVGSSASEAAATPAFQGATASPAPLSGSTGSDLGFGGGGGGGDSWTGDPLPTSTQTPVLAAGGRDFPVFPGVPWYLFVLGAGLAAGIAYGLRRWVGLVFGGGSCDRGAATGIPNLRER